MKALFSEYWGQIVPALIAIAGILVSTVVSMKQSHDEKKEKEKFWASLEPFQKIAERQFPNEDVQTALGKLSQQVEVSLKKTEELEQRTAPYRITSTTRNQLRDMLSKARSDGYQIKIAHVSGSFDSSYLANELQTIFLETGWHINDFPISLILPAGIAGIRVSSSSENPSQVQRDIIRALEKVGLFAFPAYNPKLPKDEIDITIGENAARFQ